METGLVRQLQAVFIRQGLHTAIGHQLVKDGVYRIPHIGTLPETNAVVFHRQLIYNGKIRIVGAFPYHSLGQGQIQNRRVRSPSLHLQQALGLHAFANIAGLGQVLVPLMVVSPALPISATTVLPIREAVSVYSASAFMTTTWAFFT